MKRISSVAIIVNYTKTDAIEIVNRIINELLNRGVEVYITVKLREILKDSRCIAVESKNIARYAEVFIVIGGDGTFIGVAREYSRFNVNILPVNIGHLGFLSEISAGELINRFDSLLTGKFPIERRLMLDSVFGRHRHSAVNEIAVSQRSLARLISLDIYINDDFFAAIRADGVIISTPNGSTGHSLSAGGPIVNPGLNCLIFTPLCAHSLAIRPIILAVNDRIKIIATGKSEAIITIDGQQQYPLRRNLTLEISAAEHTFNIIKLKPLPYYELIKTKLKWNQ